MAYSLISNVFTIISVNTFLVYSVLTSKNLHNQEYELQLQLVEPIGASKKGIRNGEE